MTVVPNSPRTNAFGGNTKLADIDGDGDLDVGVAPIDVDIANCGSSNDFALLRNPGTGTVSDPWAGNDDQNFHLDPHDFVFLDVNNDGSLDIFMGLCTGWRVFIQEVDGGGGHGGGSGGGGGHQPLVLYFSHWQEALLLA